MARSRPSSPASWVVAGRSARSSSLLAHARLVTLTGPGGVGKTRLALRVARDLSTGYDGGVTMVELVGRAEPALVTRAVAEAYGLHDRLTEWQVDDLVVAMGGTGCCWSWTTASTSSTRARRSSPSAAPHREPDGARDQPAAAGGHGEHLLPVPPMTVPEVDAPAVPDATAFEAVSLFVERARAATGGLRAERGERRGRRGAVPAARRGTAGHRARGRPAARAVAAAARSLGSTTASRC